MDEEELPPVSAGRLYAKHHQVTKGQHPQVGGEKELFQSAVVTGGTWDKR